MDSIKIEAAFIPKEVCKQHDPICILIDAVRASCTIATFFHKGAEEIILVDSEEAYLRSHPEADSPAYCICAEKLDGSRADLAEVSPSLCELRTYDSFAGRKVLFRTTNGTVGVRTIRSTGLQEILIGSMLNCDAVAKAAVDLAIEKQTGICTVCAGREHGEIYCIDDTYCAAAILRSIEACCASRGIRAEVQDSAKIAYQLLEKYSGTQEAYAASASGAIMRNIHMEEDLALCAQKNITEVVPQVLKVDSEGNVVLALR